MSRRFILMRAGPGAGNQHPSTDEAHHEVPPNQVRPLPAPAPDARRTKKEMQTKRTSCTASYMVYSVVSPSFASPCTTRASASLVEIREQIKSSSRNCVLLPTGISGQRPWHSSLLTFLPETQITAQWHTMSHCPAPRSNWPRCHFQYGKQMARGFASR